MTGSADDLKTVDGIELIRSHPERFLQRDRPSGAELAARMVQDILVTERQQVIALRINEWWIVASDYDWLTSSPFASPSE